METRIRLTAKQMECLTDQQVNYVDRFCDLWAILLGHSLAEHQGDIVPGEYAIPYQQCQDIIKSMGTEWPVLGLFLNKGPGTFKE